MLAYFVMLDRLLGDSNEVAQELLGPPSGIARLSILVGWSYSFGYMCSPYRPSHTSMVSKFNIINMLYNSRTVYYGKGENVREARVW